MLPGIVSLFFELAQAGALSLSVVLGHALDSSSLSIVVMRPPTLLVGPLSTTEAV